MLTVLVPVLAGTLQAVMPKNMVLDLKWFDENWMIFENWWREIQSFLKSNKIIVTEDKITISLTQRKHCRDICIERKLMRWKKKKIFRIGIDLLKKSRQHSATRVRQQIPNGKSSYLDKKRKKHITKFMIKFEVLAIKAETNNMHAIFLLKKNIRTDIIKTILGYPPIVVPETLKEWNVIITLVRQGYKSI